jgi:hypothetical protein
MNSAIAAAIRSTAREAISCATSSSAAVTISANSSPP